MNNIPPELHKYVEILLSHGGLWIYLIVAFSMFFEYVFPPFPGDVAIFSAGFIAGDGSASVMIVLISALLGSIAGLTVVYVVGRKYGRAILSRRKIWFINQSLITKTENWYTRVGAKLLLFSKFLPGVRFALVFFSGIAAVPFKKALTLTAISCLIWNSMVILLAFYLQRNIQSVYRILSTYRIIIPLILLFIILVWIIKILAKRRQAI